MFLDDKNNDNVNDVSALEDDAISLDGLLDTDEDGIVSIKDGASIPGLSTEKYTNDSSNTDADSLDIRELIGDDVDDIEPGDVDEEELRKILTSDNSSYSEDVNTSNKEDVSELLLKNNETLDEEISPRKDEIKQQKPSVSPITLALIFGLIIALIIYVIMNFVINKDDDTDSFNIQNQQNVQNNETQNTANNEEVIPVVNEDEASSLKPDEEEEKEEEEEEEKKEVVSVIPTGRINPFAPITKYLPPKEPERKPETVVKTINNIDYDSVNIPLPPRSYGESYEKTTKLMSISVSGIMYDKQKPSAIITYNGEDYFVLVGDKLDEFKVISIGPDFVKIAYGKNTYMAKVGDEFKITDFYGNAQYKGPNRQYYSSESEFMQENGLNQNGNGRYTSNKDVKIYAR